LIDKDVAPSQKRKAKQKARAMRGLFVLSS
jgi:hypothetical protein